MLGNGNLTWKSIPTKINSLTGINAIAAGQFYSLALKNDGTVWAWGSNSDGQLGDGSTNEPASPIQVIGLTGIIAISTLANARHSLALKNDGSIWAWGSNNSGQLGDSTIIERDIPIKLSRLTGIIAITAGNEHSLAVKNDGTIWAWGNNGSGQLGIGTKVFNNSPVKVNGPCAIVKSGIPVTTLKNNIPVRIYPNPFISKATLEINGDAALQNLEIKIYDILGAEVLGLKITASSTTIPRGDLPSGIYFLRLIQDAKVIATEKLVIED